jgi:outer membrane protein, heavy metal efflux system
VKGFEMLLIPLAIVLTASPLTFEEALRLAEEAPAVAATQRAVTERRRLTDSVSSLTANPQLGVQPGVRQHSRGIGPELFVTLAQPFNLASFGAARKEALARELEMDQSLGRSLLHSVRRNTARAWLSLWVAQAALAEAHRELELSTEWAGRVARATAAGGMTKGDAAAARSWQAEASLAVLSAEGDTFTGGILLNEVLGLDASEPTAAAGAPPELPLPRSESLNQSVEGAERAPAVQLMGHTRDTEEARLAEVKALNGTWLQVGVQAGREGAGDLVGQGTLQLTIPMFDHGERDQARLKALAARAEGDRKDALVRARAERVDAIYELVHTSTLLEAIEKDLLPATEDAARFAEKRMEGGEGNAFEWVLARRTVLTARTRHIRARADHLLSRFTAAELGAVTGATP